MINYLTLASFFLVVWGAALPDTQPNQLAHRSTTLSKANFSSYAPVRIECPDREQWVRPADGPSAEEAAWVKGRKQNVLKSLRSYLSRLHLDDFCLEEYLQRIEHDPERIPTIGMAISGGGWSSALTGTGALQAFDDRFEPSVEQRTGGILQSMTYLSGLSGGSWPVISLATYNNPTVQEMVGYWHTNQSVSDATKDTAHRATAATVFKQIVPKFEAGFNVSLLDFLGREFGYEFVAGADGGIATMVSDIAELSNFMNHEMPFPIWQAPMSTPDDIEFYKLKVPFYNATIYEWSPFELGTWSSSSWSGPGAFFPIKYLGTKMADGKPVDDCVVGFDRATFMLGVAADAVNFWLIEAYSNGTLGSFAKRSVGDDTLERRETATPLVEAIEGLQKIFTKYFGYTLAEDVYATMPNPFALSSSTTDDDKPPANLTLLDGSEAGQSIPLWPQIQPSRNPEFIIAWDGDQDAQPYSWSNGSNMYNAYIYATNRSIPFPLVPKPATFINRNYTFKPTFFGCDANLTNTNDIAGPIVLYMPNAPYSTYTNYTWYQSAFTDEQMAVILTNGFNYVTQGNSTLDPEWPECLGCAAIDRSLAKLGIERTEQCSRCMARYCWDGVEDNSDPGLVDLSLVLDPGLSFAEWNASTPQTGPVWGEVTK